MSRSWSYKENGPYSHQKEVREEDVSDGGIKLELVGGRDVLNAEADWMKGENQGKLFCCSVWGKGAKSSCVGKGEMCVRGPSTMAEEKPNFCTPSCSAIVSAYLVTLK